MGLEIDDGAALWLICDSPGRTDGPGVADACAVLAGTEVVGRAGQSCPRQPAVEVAPEDSVIAVGCSCALVEPTTLEKLMENPGVVSAARLRLFFFLAVAATPPPKSSVINT